jgi:methyl-accepting chemotaxis protein
VAGIGAVLVVIPVLIGLVLIRLSLRYATSGMSGMAQAIAAGDFEADFDYRARDAIGETVQSIREMAGTLKEKLGFSQGVLQGIVTPFLIVDTQETLTYTNQSLLRLLERDGKPEDFYGQNVAAFFYGDASRRTVLSGCLSSHETVSKEVELTGRKGTTKHVIIDATPLFDLDGNVIGAMCIYTDLTDIKQQQKTLQAQNERIEKVAASAVDVSSRLASASEEMASQIEQSSRGAEEQQSRASEVSTAMEQMSSSVLEISRNATDAAEGADKAKQEAEKGNQTVQNVVSHMDDISRISEQMQENLESLGSDVEGIKKVMGIINDIADQTNLLALNAAIEAARAGEAGRGFAVVADEVRKLAEKTMSATNEVGDAVTRITDGTSYNIREMGKARDGVAKTAELAHEAGSSFTAFVRAAQSNSDRINTIATAAEEQSSTSDQINQLTGEVNRTAGETSSSMQEAARAVADLNSMAQELDTLVQELKTS